MIRTILFLSAFLFALFIPAIAKEESKRIAIIKADDVRGVTPKWTRFFALSKEKGVKVSAGIICNSLQSDKKGYFKWLNDLGTSGEVEFWNHGWDHKRWAAADKAEVCEFRGSGYEHQKKHFEDAQKIMRQVLGAAPVAFGAPYNAVDADTAKVMKGNADVRLFFSYGAKGPAGKLLAPMSLRGESDGTGKPNFAKFKAEYEKKDVSFAAIQFHPNAFGDEHFGEYARILDFLIAEGWSFVLPKEYVAAMDEAKEKD